MPNIGLDPIPDSPVGQLRYTVGDTTSTPLDPPVAGFTGYAIWSDAALSVALIGSGGDILRAAGNLFLQLAAQYTQQGASIRTDDLAIDTRNRGSDFLKIAQSFFDQADGIDEAGAFDTFKIVPFAGRPDQGIWPRVEGSPWPFALRPAVIPSSGSLDGGSP